MRIARTLFVLFAVMSLKPLSAHAESFVFVINTTAEDNMGPATAPYMDETRWSQQWRTSFEKSGHAVHGAKIQIIPIRANSNQELTRSLNFWMTPLPTDAGPREVVGLGIYSHGLPMTLLNESEKFKLNLPGDIAAVFAPIIGHFAVDARIVLMGCLVLDGQSEITAGQTLASFADAFGLKRGLVYANATKGIDPYTLLGDPLNSDIRPMKRAAIFLNYLLWPLTSFVVPAASRFYYNHGYALLRAGEDRVFATRFQAAVSNEL